MAGVEDMGRKLVGEVEVVGLDEILQLLRLQEGTAHTQPFGLTQLDRLVEIAAESKPKTHTAPPTIEVLSLAPGGGKTHLLYHLSALATLPLSLSGKQASAVIFDLDNNFSISRLADQIALILRQHSAEETKIEEAVRTALTHIHIFRPQTLASTIATLDVLPTYLFDKTRHSSFERAVGFVALDSASAFYWLDRAEGEDAAFLAASNPTTTAASHKHESSGYIHLSTSLKAACKTLHCPALLATRHLGPTLPFAARAFRPAISGLTASDLRLVVRRAPVRKFPPGFCVEQAVREKEERQKVVEEGRFECFVNEWGMEERGVGRFEGAGFGFRVGREGVVVREDT